MAGARGLWSAPNQSAARVRQAVLIAAAHRPVAVLQVWSSSAGWTRVSGCLVAPMNTTDVDVGKQDCHAWLFGWKNATIFQARPHICLTDRPSSSTCWSSQGRSAKSARARENA